MASRDVLSKSKGYEGLERKYRTGTAGNDHNQFTFTPQQPDAGGGGYYGQLCIR
jgi:hypothetical protein